MDLFFQSGRIKKIEHLPCNLRYITMVNLLRWTPDKVDMYQIDEGSQNEDDDDNYTMISNSD